MSSSYSLEMGFAGVVGWTGASENDGSVVGLSVFGESVFSWREVSVLLSYELGLLRNLVGFSGFCFRTCVFAAAFPKPRVYPSYSRGFPRCRSISG